MRLSSEIYSSTFTEEFEIPVDDFNEIEDWEIVNSRFNYKRINDDTWHSVSIEIRSNDVKRVMIHDDKGKLVVQRYGS